MGDDDLTINALICDDEQSCVDDVILYLRNYCAERNITCYYKSFNNGTDAINDDGYYDIAFLDIEMGDISGLELASALKEKNKNIIIFFITNYEKYIDDAMDLFALRYLVKPINHIRFYSGLDKTLDLINEDVIEFFVKDLKKLVKINANEILYVETMSHKTKVVTTKNIYYSSNLIDYWNKTLTHSSFFRIHKSYIVNLDYVNEYQRAEVKLTNGEIIPVSYRTQSNFRKYFLEYLSRRK